MLAGLVPSAAAEIAVLFFELGVVIVALALLSRLANRFGFSPVPLYLLGGLIIGALDFVPISLVTEEFIEAGAEIGVILLLFMIGLEYTGAELSEGLRTGLPSGLVDFVFNFIPGAVLGLLLGWSWLEAALLGGVTYISSSGIIAKLLTDFNWLGNRETPAVLIVLVMEDLAMALYLPIVAVLLRGDGIMSGAASLLAAVATVIIVLLLAVRFGDTMSRFIGGNNETILLSVFGLLLLVAGVAQQLQVSAAVGAFLLGIAVSGNVAERTHTLLSPLRDLFAATFFLFFGLQTDVAALPAALPLAVGLAVVTALTKIGTGWYAAGRIGTATLGRLRAGMVLTPRGEFSIVIAGLGAAAGTASGLVPLTAAYVLVMAVLGSVMVRLVEPVWKTVQKRRLQHRPAEVRV
jgi:CPA2 family monovalent cation:H+ antiporter-2